MKRFVTLFGLLVTLACFIPSAKAADYRFRVPKAEMQVFVLSDASVRVVYDITFKNEPGAHPIDVVDIGTLGTGYNLSSAIASLDGISMPDIRKSTYVDPGFEVHLFPPISPGSTGRFHAEYIMPNAVYQDTTRKDYASLQVTPTWFGSKYVRGTTELGIAVQLPKGIKPDEVLWQDVKFAQKGVADDTVAVAWYWPNTTFDGPHRVGVSFPKGDIPVVYMSKLQLLLKWFKESPNVRLWLGIFIGLAWTFLYFRFTGFTGFSVYLVLTGIAAWLFVIQPVAELWAVPIVAGLMLWNELALKRRKSHYMPPIAQVEGGGIKRGLTAPEAALLLELPLSKVLTLVIFGMLKKGILRQVSPDPLQVAVNEPFAVDVKSLQTTSADRAKLYRKVAHETGIAVHKYEHAFLYLIQSNPTKPLAKINFNIPMKQLIAHVVERMKGFDLSDTQEYYRSIIRRALQQAKSMGDVPMREKLLDRQFEWILMDDDYPTVFTGRTTYWPIWCRGTMSHGGSVVEAAGSAVGTGGQTSFGDVASSFAGWTENTMGSMASAISPDGLGIAKPTGGFLNLKGADNLTGEILSSLADGRGGGGGGGFSGCACAGCACACACAGGGR